MSINQPKKAISGTKPNYLYAIVSVSLVLFLLGLFGVIILHANKLVDIYKEKVNLLVEIEQGTNQIDIKNLQARLNKSDFVKEGSVQFITKEEAINSLKEEFGEDFILMDMQNPLYDVISLNITADYMDKAGLEKIKNRLKAFEFVSDVYYQESLVDGVSSNIEKLAFIALGIGILFIFIAITLIHNTIKLSLYANRFLIKNMELVGASWEFISRPYIIKSIINGLISALMAIALLVFIMYIAKKDLPELQQLQDFGSFSILFIGLIVLGVSITTISTYFVVNKYLNMRTDDLY